MNKKKYIKPSTEAVKLDITRKILAGSAPESIQLYEEEVAPEYENYGQW